MFTVLEDWCVPRQPHSKLSIPSVFYASNLSNQIQRLCNFKDVGKNPCWSPSFSALFPTFHNGTRQTAYSLRDQSQLHGESFTMSHNRLLDPCQYMRITVTFSMRKELDIQLDERSGFLLCRLRLRRGDGITANVRLKATVHPQLLWLFFCACRIKKMEEWWGKTVSSLTILYQVIF